MLPFTKRPGRDGEDDEVVSKRSVPPPPKSERPRKPAPSVSDEVTSLMPVKSLGPAAPHASPRPAAGMPAIPPATRSRPATVPPPAKKALANPFAEEESEDDDGATVVRGQIKKSMRFDPEGNPTTISPAAVIKQTLESARAAKNREPLMLSPADFVIEDDHPADAGPQRTVQLSPSQPPPPPSSTRDLAQLGLRMGVEHMMPIPPPPQSQRPPPQSYPAPPQSQRPPPQSYPAPPQSYPAPPLSQPPPMSGPYGFSAPMSSNVPGVVSSSAVPAHFMMAGMDPPATSVTSRTLIKGRPAMPWAAALLAFGLFVGVGAVAVLQGGADSLADTSASFVDPSRAPGAAKAAAAAAQQAPAQMPTPVTAVTAVTTTAAGDQAPSAAPVAATPVATPVAVAATQAPVTAPPVTAPEPKPESKPEPKAAVASRPVYRAPPPPPAARPQPKPVEKPEKADKDEAPAPVAASESKKGGAKGGAKAGGKGDDEEMKKALEQLQKSQLESTF